MPTFEGEQVESRVFDGELVEPSGAPEQEGPDSGALAFVNRGIANLFGLPGDVINAANRYVMDPMLGAAGMPETQRLPIGSQAIESGLRQAGVGVPQPGERADDPAEVAAREIGAGIASLLPFGAAARSARAAIQAGRGGAVTRTLADAAETTGRRPITTSAAELGSIAGAGAGAGAARGVAGEESPALETLGALAGGLSPAVIGTVPSTVKLGARAARAAVDPFTREGSTFRAARRAQQLAADPQQAAQRLSEDEILPESRGLIPPAQRTGESRLVGLQRALTDEDAGLEQRIGERVAVAEQQAREAGRDIGGAPAESARQFLAQRRNAFVERFQKRASQAVNRAQDRLARLEDASPEQESRIVRDELENALKSAQTEESRLWNRVPRDTRVLSRESRQTFDAMQAEQGRLSDPEDIPQLLRERMPEVRGREQIGELQDLRSQVLRDIRAERAKDAPNRRKLANLERMQQALLEDMSRSRKGGRKLQEALAFSRVLNERFRQGPIGRVLGFERQGGPSVGGGEMMSRVLRGREAGGEGVDALRRALGEADEREAADTAMNQVLQASRTQEGQQAVGRFLESTFRLQAVNPDGTVSPSAARQFLKRNNEVLQRFPETRQRIESAAESQRGAERAAKQADRMTRAVGQKSKSRLALYLDTPPERAMQRVIDSDDPTEAAKSLVASAKKDESGLAMRGLKDELVNTLMRQAETGSVNEAGERMVSGRRMTRLLDNPQAQKVAQQILSSDERKRLKQIANTFAKIEAGRDRAPRIGRPMEDLASSVLEIPSRILGARAGAAAGGHSMAGGLQSAQILSARVRDMLRSKFSDKAREVLTDAVQDEDLFRQLMTMPTSRPKVRQIEQRLNAWIGAPATQQVGSEQDAKQRAQ